MQRSTRVEERKVFETSLRGRSLQPIVYFQPSFFVSAASLLLTIVVKRHPEYFLPSRYLIMTWNGIRLSSLMTIPFLSLSILYCAIASLVCTGPTPLLGHSLGILVSASTGLYLCALGRTSLIYPTLGCGYLAFGAFHHYRRLMIESDNAPLFYWSDFADIYRAKKRKRQQTKYNNNNNNNNDNNNIINNNYYLKEYERIRRAQHGLN